MNVIWVKLNILVELESNKRIKDLSKYKHLRPAKYSTILYSSWVNACSNFPQILYLTQNETLKKKEHSRWKETYLPL